MTAGLFSPTPNQRQGKMSILFLLVFFILILAVMASSLAIVDRGERAWVETSGKYNGRILKPGSNII
jgi:regulator of protease activity HflC (stomatin/prohibitin superfamily)